MRTAISKSKQTIAVLSPAYLKSKYATAELNAALADDPLGEKGKLVPVRVQPCSPTELMRDRVYIDLVEKPTHEARRHLIAGIEASRIGIKQLGRGLGFRVKPRFPGPSAISPANKTKPDTGGASKSPSNPLRILFLASEAGTGLDLRGQYREIKAAIKRSSQARAIQMKGVFDLTAERFLDALNSYTPDVLHFSGKQDGGDILINSERGGVTVISDLALGGLLRSLDEHIRLAIIDTCSSLRCAKSVSEVVDCAIGVKSDVYEEDANRFYVAFYRALASGRSLKDACGQATAASQFAGVPQNEIPQLIARRGVDPAKIVLVLKERPLKRKAATRSQQGRAARL
jgi:hypothetical protein